MLMPANAVRTIPFLTSFGNVPILLVHSRVVFIKSFQKWLVEVKEPIYLINLDTPIILERINSINTCERSSQYFPFLTYS